MSYTTDIHGKRIPRTKAGTYSFVCPDCGREHKGVLWMDKMPKGTDPEEASMLDTFTRGEKKCRCGAYWLVAETDYEGHNGLFKLNHLSDTIIDAKPEEKP